MESIYKLSVLFNLIDRASGPLRNIKQGTGEAITKFQEYGSKMAGMATDGVVLIGTGQQIVAATMAPIKATFETKDAISELASLGIEKLGLLEDASKSFSDTWAGTTKPEFLTAAYDIKSGIASLSDEGVAEYTRLAGITAKGTKSTITEMTSLFATGYGIYKDFYSDLSDIEFAEMFGAGIAKSVQQFKTTGSGMAQAISALGGSATSANVPMEEQLAILGMLQATMSGGEAGTKYTAFLQSAAKAGKTLGLNFLDANGQLVSMPEILGTLKSKFGETMTAADKLELQKAFGSMEAVKLIDLLYGKTDDLQGNIITLYDTMGQGFSIAEEMANKINAPPGQSWEILQQKMQGTLEVVGNAMLPTFIELQKVMDILATTLSNFAEKHPYAVSAIMYLIMAFGALLFALGVGKLALGALGSAMLVTEKTSRLLGRGLDKLSKINFSGMAMNAKKTFESMVSTINTTTIKMVVRVQTSFASMALRAKTAFLSMAASSKTALVGMMAWVKQGIMSAVAALPGLIASVWSFTVALLANPVTWIVIGIIALIGVIYLLAKNWDVVTAKLAEFKEFGKNIIMSFVEGIKAVAMAPFNAVKGALEKVRNLLPFSDAKEGPLSDLTLSGKRVFETINTGMLDTSHLPADTMNGAFGDMDTEYSNFGAGSSFDTEKQPVKQTIIERVFINCDISSIEDLKKLKKLLSELEDEDNSNPEPVPVGG